MAAVCINTMFYSCLLKFGITHMARRMVLLLQCSGPLALALVECKGNVLTLFPWDNPTEKSHTYSNLQIALAIRHHLSKRLHVQGNFFSAHLENFGLLALWPHSEGTTTCPKLEVWNCKSHLKILLKLWTDIPNVTACFHRRNVLVAAQLLLPPIVHFQVFFWICEIHAFQF